MTFFAVGKQDFLKFVCSDVRLGLCPREYLHSALFGVLGIGRGASQRLGVDALGAGMNAGRITACDGREA